MNHYTIFELLWLFRIHKAYPKAKRIDLKEDADRTEEKAQVLQQALDLSKCQVSGS